MKINIMIILLMILSIICSFFNYDYFLLLLSILWYVVSVLIIYSSIKYSIIYKFKQLNIKEIIKSLKSKSKNEISPLSSLSISLAAKIGVGSLSGVALAIYYGGIGSIFFMMIISLLISINTYVECILGIKYREKINNVFNGGPVFYIKKCLNNRGLSIIYGILIVVIYSGLFMGIQANTIVKTMEYYKLSPLIIVIILCVLTLIIILRGIDGIKRVNNKLVPIMLIIYLCLGIYVMVSQDNIAFIIKQIFREAFKVRSIIPVFLIGMQRAIFITEAGIGTSAISASVCDNDSHSQGMLEVLGIHITSFIVCLTTALIIVTSDYRGIVFNNPNGIEIVMYAFKYHFGDLGIFFLTIITIMFAFSTILSGYFFGESNLAIFSNKKRTVWLNRIFVLGIIFISGFIAPNFIWNMTDFFVAILTFINIYSIIKIKSI